MGTSLLEKAKRIGRANFQVKPITQEHIDLALAWCRDEIGLRQVAVALGFPNRQTSSAYVTLARALKHHVRSKKK